MVEKLSGAGAILRGKTGMHEWAYGITSNNPHFGPVRDPSNPGRISGGSSDGSAADLAAGLCRFSLGSDTGESIRIPAALCGIAGLKPTFGRGGRNRLDCRPWYFLIGATVTLAAGLASERVS